MVDLDVQRALAQRVIARWMKGITPMNERPEPEPRSHAVASTKVPISHHDHVGHMVYEATSASCESCGQRWELRYDAHGRPSGWWASAWHPSRQVLQATFPPRRPVSSFDPDEDAA